MNHAPYLWSWRLATAMLFALCFGIFGCGSMRLAQTHDTELVYAVGDAPDVLSRVRARLGAARIAAGVEERRDSQNQRELRVTVDADLAPDADDLLRWRGGITLHRVDPGTGKPISPPLVDFADRISLVTTARRGRDLVIFTTVTMRSPPKEPLAIVLAGSVLATQVVENSPSLTISFGDDLDSFALAERAKRLLDSPTLPPLTPKSEAQPVPPHWGIGALGLILPVLLSFGWLSFVQRFDRAHPEPLWLVGATFVLGGVLGLLAWIVEYGLTTFTPYLHPTTMTFGGQLWAAPVALLVFTVVVGLPEEASKYFGAWSLARHRHEFDEPIDGIVYGVASSLGFAALENIRYFAMGRLATSVVVMRAFTSVPAHMFFGAIWGYALGRKLVSPRTSVFKFLVFAALLHGAYDTFLSVRGLSSLTLVLHLFLTSLFIVLLRRALRRGIIPSGETAPESSRRLSFALGSPMVFALWAILLHVAAVAIVALGIYLDRQSQRIDVLFLSGATALLVLFGIAAHGLVATLPLEAVVDENGVTFGGATRSWSQITGFERRRASRVLGTFELVIRSPAGPLRIGPGKDNAITTLAACLSSYTGQS